MYLDRRQMAESFGVSERVVEDWVRRDGLPSVVDRGRLLFDREQVAHWAAKHGLAARAGFLAAPSARAGWLRLEPMLRAGGIWRAVPSTRVLDTLEIVIDRLPATEMVRRFLKERLRAAGGVNWAPVGCGIALPHFTTRVALGQEAGAIAFLLLEGPMPGCEPPDDVPVRHLVFFIPPSPRTHLETLGRLSRALATGPLQELLRGDASDEALYGAIAAADAPGWGGAAP